MQSEILLITPPLTQLNTPYPATAYISGFLKSQNIPFRQEDLGLDFVLAIFNRNGLISLFDAIEKSQIALNPALANVLANRQLYESTVDAVIEFLQQKNYTLGYRIARRNYLPEGPRFKQVSNLEQFFGSIGVQDQARYLASIYLEDLSDLIQATVGPHFGFSKYAERIGRTAVSFDPVRTELEKPASFLDLILLQQLERYFQQAIPAVVGLTVPFPGNLYGALKAGQWIKKNYPDTSIILGGGYANTELRELYDPRVFDYVDFITLDDGEGPIKAIWNYINSDKNSIILKRTFIKKGNKVEFVNNDIRPEINHASSSTPTYEGLKLQSYLSMYDVPNPMHRLWNDGRWNKLTIAHGCYWKKCSFCDISLDYIARYEQAPTKMLVDKMEQLIEETGEHGFHFVDEAAPPAALRDLAIEILRRNLQVTWWTNIRFEKTFNADLCKLLAASGCVAVTGGLEVASDRLLQMMEKGVSVEQVARVCQSFRDAGILVHAYLMYGFPTQTAQETIDSLEVVRQMFSLGLLQSAYWHRFAMTVHSPVGKDPDKYKVIRTGPVFEGFANNDLFHEDPSGADHSLFSEGLNKALYNYMHGKEWNTPLSKFFHFVVPATSHHANLIAKYLKIQEISLDAYKTASVILDVSEIKCLNKDSHTAELLLVQRNAYVKLELPLLVANYLMQNESALSIKASQPKKFAEFAEEIKALAGIEPEALFFQPWWKKFRSVCWLMR